MVPGLQINLFATESNLKLPSYVAPNLVTLAFASNALSVDWNQWEAIYLFPPVNLLLKVLHKLLQGPNSPHRSELAQEQLIPAANGAPSQSHPPFHPRNCPRWYNRDCIRFILTNEDIGFMDFLVYAAIKLTQSTWPSHNFGPCMNRAWLLILSLLPSQASRKPSITGLKSI